MLLNNFSKTHKKFLALGLVVLIVGAGIFWQANHNRKKVNEPANLTAAVASADAPPASPPDQISLGKETIPLLWTDNNDGENLIIKTDKQYYNAAKQITVYFSVDNRSGQDQSADIYFWFDGADKKVERVEKIVDGKQESLKIENSDLFKNLKFKIKNFSRKAVNGYTAGSKFTDKIATGQINYYKAVLKYPDNPKQTEFFIEAIGDKNGYGHLDPYVAGGLVGYWTFDGKDTNWTSATAGTINDLSGNNNTGTLTNMSRSVSPTPGISGQALKFDGVDDYVFLPSAPFNLTTFTISLWVNPSATEPNWATLIAKGNTASIKDYNFICGVDGVSNTQYYCAIGNGTTYDGYSNLFFTLTPNTWNHIIFTVDGAFLKIFVNGLLAHSPWAQTITPINNSVDPRIGSDPDSGSLYFFKGSIDDVRIYNRALSASEISDLYRTGAARLKVNTPVGSGAAGLASGLVGYWTFNGQDTNWTSPTTGTTNDLSGNNNTGTLTNMSRSSSPVPGISGQALNFDGVDDLIQTTNLNDAAMTENSPLTISAWIKPKSAGQASASYIALRGSVLLQMYGGSTAMQFSVGGTPQIYRFSSDNSITYNTWQHIVLTWDGSTNASNIHFYVNNSLKDGFPSNGANPTDNSADILYIGNYSSPLRSFDGLIDDVRIYNRALSAGEISDLYRTGAARLKVNTPVGSGAQGLASGLMGYWTFDGKDTNWTSATAGTTNDLSGNNNTGTLTNMSQTSSPAPGISGQALKFAGNAGATRILTPNPMSSFMSASDGSISAWAKLTSTPVGGTCNNVGPNAIVSDAFGGGYVALGADSTYGWCGGGFDTVNRFIYTPYTLNTWTYLVWTHAGGYQYLYKDGVLANFTALGNISNLAFNLQIGAGYTAYYFPGLIDDVRIYNRALTPDEILQLYRAGSRRVKIKQ